MMSFVTQHINQMTNYSGKSFKSNVNSFHTGVLEREQLLSSSLPFQDVIFSDKMGSPKSEV